MKKVCIKCGILKLSSMYYGKQGECKECTKKRTKENRLAKLEYYQEYDRKRASLPHRVKLRKKVAKRWKEDPKLKRRSNELKKIWQEKNVLKRAAHVITGNAIREGKLIKKPCEACGKKKVDAHHDDYTKPLEVKWLCKKHHSERHKESREIRRKKNK